VQDATAGDATTGFSMVGTGDDDTLELSLEGVHGEVELVVPTRAIPWRELSLLEVCGGQRPRYGGIGPDPAEDLQRILEPSEVQRILGLDGLERAYIDQATTRLVLGRGQTRLILSDIRLLHGTRLPMRAHIRRPDLKGSIGWIHVGQRSGGKLTGGISLQLNAHLDQVARYDVRRRQDHVEVTRRG
jgi:hypothetical protein